MQNTTPNQLVISNNENDNYFILHICITIQLMLYAHIISNLYEYKCVSHRHTTTHTHIKSYSALFTLTKRLLN